MSQYTLADVPRLIEQGYRCVSRKYGMVSRIDREDWQEFMAQQHAPWDIEEGRRWIKALGPNHAADQLQTENEVLLRRIFERGGNE